MTNYEISTTDAYPPHWLHEHERPTPPEGLDLISLRPGATPTDPAGDDNSSYPTHWTN